MSDIKINTESQYLCVLAIEEFIEYNKLIIYVCASVSSKVRFRELGCGRIVKNFAKLIGTRFFLHLRIMAREALLIFWGHGDRGVYERGSDLWELAISFCEVYFMTNTSLISAKTIIYKQKNYFGSLRNLSGWSLIIVDISEIWLWQSKKSSNILKTRSNSWVGSEWCSWMNWVISLLIMLKFILLHKNVHRNDVIPKENQDLLKNGVLFNHWKEFG